MRTTQINVHPGEKKLWQSSEMAHTIKNKNELRPHASPWMNLRNMMLLLIKSHKISHRTIHLYKVPKYFICIYMDLFLNIKHKEMIHEIFRTEAPRLRAESGTRASALVMFYFLGWAGGTWVLILLFLITQHIYVTYPPLPIW